MALTEKDRKRKRSQEAKVLAHLLSGKDLTVMEALKRGWGIALPARIWYLIHRDGWNIISERIDDEKAGTFYHRYYMGTPKRIPGFVPPEGLKGKH